jgi:hypothetical protein
VFTGYTANLRVRDSQKHRFENGRTGYRWRQL